MRIKKVGLVRQSSDGSAIFLLIAILGIILLLKIAGVFSFIAGCPVLPSNVFNGTYGTGSPQPVGQYSYTGLGVYIQSCQNSFANSSAFTQPIAITYQLGNIVQFTQSNGYPQPVSADGTGIFNVSIAFTKAGVVASNLQDNATAKQLQAAMSYDRAQASAGGGPAWGARALADQSLLAIAQAAIAYNNAIQAAPTYQPVPTQTTTVGGSTASNAPPTSPPAFSFTLMLSQISNFVQNILKSFAAYFGVASGLLSIAGTNLQANNLTYVGTPITITASLSINQSQTSNTWSVAVSKVTSTFCASYVYSNSTKQYTYQSAIANMTTTAYSSSFVFTPQASGLYIAGAACQSSYTSFSNGVWSAWSAPQQIAMQNIAIYAVPTSTSLVAPTTSATISTNFFSSLANSIQNFINGIGMFFKSLFGR